MAKRKTKETKTDTKKRAGSNLTGKEKTTAPPNQASEQANRWTSMYVQQRVCLRESVTLVALSLAFLSPFSSESCCAASFFRASSAPIWHSSRPHSSKNKRQQAKGANRTDRCRGSYIHTSNNAKRKAMATTCHQYTHMSILVLLHLRSVIPRQTSMSSLCQCLPRIASFILSAAGHLRGSPNSALLQQ